MKTEDPAYASARAMRAQEVRQFLRFTNPSTYGSATEFAFAVDWSSGEVGGSTKTKRPWIVSITGNTQTVEPELGRSSIGFAKVGLLDSRGQMLKYFSNVALTLNGAHDSVTTTIIVNQDTLGYPDIGTVEILTTGVRERVRYTGKTPLSFTGCTRGVDGTSAAAHSNGDAVSNGEQIRRGTRVQLFTGYAHLDETRYRSEWKMEVIGRSMDKDRVTTILRLQDIQRRPSRATVFLTASQNNPVGLSGNPINCALAMLLSQGTFTALAGTLSKTAGSASVTGVGTDWNVSLAVGSIVRCPDGELLQVASGLAAGAFTAATNAILTASGVTARKGGTNGTYDVLDKVDAIGIPSAFVDVTTWEALRVSDFSTDRYQFSLVTRENAKSFLEDQFMKTLNCYPVINQTGQLSIVRFRVAVGVPTVTLDPDSIIGYDWLPADDQVINRVQFNYDFNVSGAEGIYGVFQEFLSGIETDDTTSIGKFGKSTPLQIDAMGWRSTLAAATNAAARAKQVTDRFAFPQNILILDCTFSRNQLMPGDQVYVNDPRLPNIKTGLRGISNEVFEVLDVTTSYRPYKVQLTLLWVASIAAVASPTDQGTVPSTIPYLTAPVDEQDLNDELGSQVAGFAYFHKGVFGTGSPRTSYREASLEFAFVQTSGDVLAYDVLAQGGIAANTVGGFDLAAIERGPENAASASGTTLVLNAAASGVDSTYNTMFIEILSNGTPAANGQVRAVTSYTGASKTAVVPAWSTTPTGTISYRIVRTGARDFGNDSNGLSGKPTSTLGAATLDRWVHREITLPSAWDTKTIIGAATAMDGAPSGQTQTLLFRNVVLKRAGVVVEAIGRYAYTLQPVWAYGTEQNATATVRLAVVGQAAPTTGITNFAVSRGDTFLDNTGGNVSTSETVLGTITPFVGRKTDRVRIFGAVVIKLHVLPNAGKGGSTGDQVVTLRIRRTNVAGTIVDTKAVALATLGDAGGSPVGANVTQSPVLHAVDEPGVELTTQTYVLTAIYTNTANSAAAPAWDELKFDGWVVSA